MTVLFVLLGSAAVLGLAGRTYANFLARRVGEDPHRPTPAVVKSDGRDYVPTPTPVVFAHHFASIAGAGPIIGPVLAIIYGWGPALFWVLIGGITIGAVHDYLATYIATREGGQSIATIAKRMLGKDAFVALTLFLILMLALVCAAFLNASATALTSMLPFDRLGLSTDQAIFRVVDNNVVIGGIASMSVVCITAVAPLVGYLYLKRKVAVWKCSILAVIICGVSITIGVFHPIAFKPNTWKLMLSAYVLVAAGLPVWIFLQSRDFINVHILYVGMAALFVTLVIAGLRNGSATDPIPFANLAEGRSISGPPWPMVFILIACGAVSGFHSLCAGGTTCKQLTSEVAARRIGYYGMLLETFLAICVISVLMIAANRTNYIADVHPQGAKGNPILGFAMAVGQAGRMAFGAPVAAGALAGMVLLEGFLVTTLDTAIRLKRYLIEEIWRTFFGIYDVFADQAGPSSGPGDQWGTGDRVPAGASGIPIAPDRSTADTTLQTPVHTTGVVHAGLKLLRMYWFNSGLAVALTLAFALTGGVGALWAIFATSNQLLAAIVLLLASIWLLRQARSVWFALLPAMFMLVTTGASLYLLVQKFWLQGRVTLLVADLLLVMITAYLLTAGVRATIGYFRAARAGTGS